VKKALDKLKNKCYINVMKTIKRRNKNYVLVENKNIELITKQKIKKFWDKNSDILKYYFGRKVVGDIAQFDFDKKYPNQQIVKEYTELNEEGTCKLRQLNRLKYGYNGLGGKLTPSVTGLKSKKALESHYNDNTNDHLFGVTKVGWKIHTLIKELYDKGKSQDYIVNHMTEKWLPNNLHLWVCVQITKEEHKSDNLARDKHTLEEKNKMVHFDEGQIVLYIED